jgi:5-methylcytosine-specific restriction endonuclease McrA
MRIELLIFLATALLIFNIYTDGKYFKLMFQYKKYYQMAAIALGGLFIYFMIKKNPLNMGSMLATTSDYLKYMPIDKGTSSILNPILDFTRRQDFNHSQETYGGSVPVLPVDHIKPSAAYSGERVKRSVSNYKKRFIGARQGWRCGQCQNQLTATYEVDHKIRLDQGGSNHIDNLVAMCRECHGMKTTMENL